MYDSFNNILEQQQRIANMCNKIYTPGLLKMQESYIDMVTRMQPSMTVALQNMSRMSNIVEKSLRNLDTDKFLNAYNQAMVIDTHLTQSMTSALKNIDVDRFVSLAQRVTLQTEVLDNFLRTLSLMLTENITSNIYDTIQSVPDSVWETLSDEEGYSKEEIQAELEVMKRDDFPITDIEGLTTDQVKEKMWVWLWENHPKIATVLMVLVLTLATIGLVDIVNEYFIPMGQNAIVKMQGNEDIFFIQVDSAKLYTEPDAHSIVIMKLLYSEEVTVVESIKLWDKVIYVNSEGEEITGWIAKRNLIAYQDYQFNSDDLYDVE